MGWGKALILIGWLWVQLAKFRCLLIFYAVVLCLAQKNHYFCTWKLALPHFLPSEATFHCGLWWYAQIFGDKSLNFALKYIKLPLNTTFDILIINVLTICAVRDHIPLKEGLRRYVGGSMGGGVHSQRPYSIKRRIKTMLTSELLARLSRASETIFH